MIPLLPVPPENNTTQQTNDNRPLVPRFELIPIRGQEQPEEESND
jgi:hypothetical protein